MNKKILFVNIAWLALQVCGQNKEQLYYFHGQRSYSLYNSCSARKKENPANPISSTNHSIHANKELSP